MKRLIIIACCLLAFVPIKAQWDFGIKGGVGSTTQQMGSHWDTKNKLGLLAGGLVTYGLGDHFDLQGELYYANRGFKTDIWLDFNASKSSDWYFTYHYLCMPVMLKYFPMKKGFYAAVGPHIAYLLDYKNDIKDWPANEPRERLDWESGCNRIDVGLSASLGVILNNGIFVDARYNLGLTDALKDGESKNRGFELSVGYFF